MKNFVRALRCSWPYRGRLLISFICALIAAALWGGTFATISPILNILNQKKNIQEWAATKIKSTDEHIKNLTSNRKNPSQEVDELNEKPSDPRRDQRLRDLTKQLAGIDGQLNSAEWQVFIYKHVQFNAERFLPTDPFQTLALVLVLIVAGVAVRGFFDFWQEALVGSVVNLTLFDLRNKLYRKVIHFDVNIFSEDGTHELMARFTNDMEMLGAGTKTLFGKVIAEPLKAIVCIGIACWFSWQLSLMFLVLVPVAGFILTKVGRTMKRATRRMLERMANLYKILQESFLGIRVVKAFTMEPYERRRFCNATKDYYQRAMWVVKLDAITSPIIELLGVAAITAALLAGAYLVVKGEEKIWGIRLTNEPLDFSALLTLYVLLGSIADPVRKLSSVYTRIQSGAAAADRVFTFMDREPKVRGNANCPRLQPHAEGIDFRDICFSYEPGRPILTDIHLDVRHGETIALVGRNGCGKSTLVGLLPRFFDPDHGSIIVDGHDIRNVNLRSLRQQIGIVTQETTLFDDTVYNNIAYGSRWRKLEDVESAARRAYAHDFIMKMSDGYQTRIGEAGGKLSGGQKQRLALARAIIRDPRILVLDEFTSQTDVESEILIHKALREFVRGRTTFVITHRLSTLEIADRIVMLEAGRIISVGTHDELLKSSAEYQRMRQRLSA